MKKLLLLLLTIAVAAFTACFAVSCGEDPEKRTDPTASPTTASTTQTSVAPDPTEVPTTVPTAKPAEPTTVPTAKPAEPTALPTAKPTAEPTDLPTATPTAEPTALPTVKPTAEPTALPTAKPTAEPTALPTVKPTAEPTAKPTVVPTIEPTEEPLPHEHEYTGEYTEPATCNYFGYSYELCTCGARRVLNFTEYPAGHDFSGGACLVCGLPDPETADFSEIEVYAGNYGYTELAKRKNGAALQEAYRVLDGRMNAYHLGGGDAFWMPRENRWLTESVPVGNLSNDDMMLLLNIYRYDHPLFYWMSDVVLADSANGVLYVATEADFASAETRRKLNEDIRQKAKEWTLETQGLSVYERVLCYHDEMLSRLTYAEDEEGVPKEALYYHGIVSAFFGEETVCEGYTKVVQLLLNFQGVDNVFVVGHAGGDRHSWNLVKMDDGNWYWVDLTWDQKPNMATGFTYDYFCKTDTESLADKDYNWHTSGEYFLVTHSLDFTPASGGQYYLYDLPARSSTPYAGADTVHSVFTEGGLIYAIAGYKKVQLIGINESGEVTVPESVTHGGKTYTVVAMGGFDPVKKVFAALEMGGTGNPTVVSIPKTVKYIWDMPLTYLSLQEIRVADDNPAYTAVNGVLFTKDLYTLVKYPSAKTDANYTIPDGTVDIAYAAFRNVANLKKLVIGKNVGEKIGAQSFGCGFPTATKGCATYSTGEWTQIRFALANAHVQLSSLAVSPENAYYSVKNGALYGNNGSVLIYLPAEAETFSLDENVIVIRSYALCGQTSEIRYAGTMEKWNAIVKENMWQSGLEKVVCSDGTISING